jgi:hypothetical protein
VSARKFGGGSSTLSPSTKKRVWAVVKDNGDLVADWSNEYHFYKTKKSAQTWLPSYRRMFNDPMMVRGFYLTVCK